MKRRTREHEDFEFHLYFIGQGNRRGPMAQGPTGPWAWLTVAWRDFGGLAARNGSRGGAFTTTRVTFHPPYNMVGEAPNIRLISSDISATCQQNGTPRSQRRAGRSPRRGRRGRGRTTVGESYTPLSRIPGAGTAQIVHKSCSARGWRSAPRYRAGTHGRQQSCIKRQDYLHSRVMI